MMSYGGITTRCVDLRREEEKMWTIHRVESIDGDLTVYARNPDGGEFPRWAAGEALARAAEALPCRARGRGTVRPLTAGEAARERDEAAACEATLGAVCASAAGRRALDAAAGEIRRCSETVAYAAIDYPGAGWRGDSAAYVHIPVGG